MLEILIKVVPILISLSALIHTIYSNYTSSVRTMALTRYQNLIFPLFSLVEPYLYKQINSFEFEILLSKISNLFNENKIYAGGKLIEAFDFLCSKSDQKNFDHFCFTLCKELDSCCKKIRIKPRTYAYRINKHQYKNKFELCWQIFLFSAPDFMLLIFTFILLALVIK